MKRKLFYALLSVVVILLSVSAVSAQNAVDSLAVNTTEAEVVVEPDAILVSSARLEQMEAKSDSLYKLQAEWLSNIENRVSGLQFNRNRNIIPNDVKPFLIMIPIAFFVLLIIFWVLKFAYESRVKRYELKKLQIERAEYLPVPMQIERTEMSMTRFIRRLMVIAIAMFFILAWIAVASNVGFFEMVLLLALLGSVGFAVVHLFKLYVQRRDEDK